MSSDVMTWIADAVSDNFPAAGKRKSPRCPSIVPRSIFEHDRRRKRVSGLAGQTPPRDHQREQDETRCRFVGRICFVESVRVALGKCSFGSSLYLLSLVPRYATRVRIPSAAHRFALTGAGAI